MLLTAQNIKSTSIMCITMAVTLFLMRGYYGEVEFTPINLIPYLISALFGVIVVLLYLHVFPSQRKDKFLTFFIPGIVLTIGLLQTGLADLWLIDELMFMLSFMFSGQELSKNTEKSV